MSACYETGKWITDTIVTPTEKFIDETIEKCEEARRWVEREVRRPVERERTRQEKRCKQRPCRKICLCCNKWFCWIVTIVYRVIEYIIEVVGECLVETVCKILMQTVKIIADVISTVVYFVATGVVCLVTFEWRGVLDSFIDLWFGLIEVVENLGRLIEIAFEAIEDGLDITARFVRDLGEWLGAPGRLIFGIVSGLIDAARQLIAAGRSVVVGLISAVTALARLDFCGAAANITFSVVDGLVYGVPAALNIVPGVGARGARDAFFRQAAKDRVRKVIDELARERAQLKSKPGFDFRDPDGLRPGDVFVPPEIDALDKDELADRIDLDARSWAIPWSISAYRLAIPSRSNVLDLAQMHLEDTIDLYKVAGYAPIAGEKCFLGRAWRVVYRGTDKRVRIADIRAYLDRGKQEAPEFDLVSMQKSRMQRDLRTARRKFRTVGLLLEIGSIETRAVREPDRIPEPSDIANPTESEFVTEIDLRPDGDTGNVTPWQVPFRSGIERLLIRHGLENDPCNIPAIGVFQYKAAKDGSEQFGSAGVVWPYYFEPPGQNPSDYWRRVNNLNYPRIKPVGGTYRGLRGESVLGYVIAHELGHAFGLRHDGHDGLHHIMFQGGQNDWTAEFGQTLVAYVMAEGEPDFSMEDVENVWRWILVLARDCLPAPQTG